LAIARAWRPRLAILGRSPEPAPEPDWLATLTTDAEIKRALIARAPAGTMPKAIAGQCQQILAEREVANQLARLRASGAAVSYHSVNVCDASNVMPIISGLERQFGPVKGILHGAGVLADQRIEDKTQEQFERVFQTKIHGL
jgi:NADP-dependent 3-hydroxy acid dehydrogenase YdfG